MFARNEGGTERFAPTSGRPMGVTGILVSVGFVVVALVRPDSNIPLWAVALAVFVGVLSWAALLRPGVSMDAESLTLRGMLTTVRLPLARIESVVVQQYMAVNVDGKRYVSPAVARTRRQQRRDERTGSPSGGSSRPSMPSSVFSAPRIFREDAGGASSRAVAAGGGMSYGYYVESKVTDAVAEARRRRGVDDHGDDPGDDLVERRPAWVEIALLTISAVVTVALIAA